MDKSLFTDEPMFSAEWLLKKRWLGMTEDELIEKLDEIPTDGSPAVDFPQPYWGKGTRQEPNTGKLVTEYLPWEVKYYSVDEDYFEFILFKFSAIEQYEEKYPQIKHKLVDLDREWEKRLKNGLDITRIEALENELAEIKDKCEKYRGKIKTQKVKIADLESKLYDPDTNTRKNYDLWEQSVKGAMKFLVAKINGEKKNWTKTAFIDALRKESACNTVAAEAAWAALPKTLKSGEGRPRKP